MRKRLTRRQQIALGTGILCVLALVQTGVAQGAARVTAAVGTALSDGDALEHRAALADVADLETGDDGNCSLLVDQDALMELCGDTSLKLDRKAGQPDGPRVVRLDRGEIRMVVEPRLAEERIEIHTPAAIATLLGTVVHVSVDALGVTTITSAASQVLVQSSDPSIPGSTTVDVGQQIVMAPGEAPPRQPTRVSPKMLASLGGCLIDFHAVALGGDRGAHENQKVEELVSEDIVDELPPVAAAPVQPSGTFETAVNDLQSDVNNPNQDPPNDVIDNNDVLGLLAGGLPGQLYPGELPPEAPDLPVDVR